MSEESQIIKLLNEYKNNKHNEIEWRFGEYNSLTHTFKSQIKNVELLKNYLGPPSETITIVDMYNVKNERINASIKKTKLHVLDDYKNNIRFSISHETPVVITDNTCVYKRTKLRNIWSNDNYELLNIHLTHILENDEYELEIELHNYKKFAKSSEYILKKLNTIVAQIKHLI